MARKKPEATLVKKNPVGRPSKYKPEYCEELIEHMSKGLSFESFAGKLGVTRITLYDWEKAHADFLYAKRIGMEKNLIWWEQQGSMGLWQDKEGPTLNNTVWVFSMKNRHKWQDKHEIETKDGDLDVRSKIQALPMDELKKLVAEKLGEKE